MLYDIKDSSGDVEQYSQSVVLTQPVIDPFEIVTRFMSKKVIIMYMSESSKFRDLIRKDM